jgi:hypothetical protein
MVLGYCAMLKELCDGCIVEEEKLGEQEERDEEMEETRRSHGSSMAPTYDHGGRPMLG